MPHLYIDQHGCQLAISQQQLIVRQKDKSEQSYPLAQIQRIIITSQVHFTAAALKALFNHHIATLFCSQSGYLIGQLKSGTNNGAQVIRRAKQYKIMDDPCLSLQLASQLINAKAHNQQRLLAYWSLNKQFGVSDFFPKIKNCHSLDSLRGFEGLVARRYFSAIRHQLKDSEFDFPARKRHPAPDPVNALLSFAYALLQSELTVITESYGLDNFVGFLHQSSHSQPALILDLMEPFRPLVDRLVVKLLLHDYTADDFVMTEQGCRIKDKRRAIFLNAWENLLSSPLKQGESHTYRSYLQKQVSEWVHFLEGKSDFPQWWLMHKGF